MSRMSNSLPGTVNRGTPKEYNGNYLGIVVQNNDPSKRGRVKVFVPHVTAAVYEGWDRILKDKKFKFIGQNIDSDLSHIIDNLKQILPWAECAAPLVGASGSGRYNSFNERGTISDSNKIVGTFPNSIESKYNLNTEGVGEKPARVYETEELKVSDAFTSTESTGSPRNINKLAHNYKPSSYSNSPKGTFSVPNVGSHVWVFFAGGDPNSPVYFASSYGQSDWKLINNDLDDDSGIDYPGAYENINANDDPNYDHNIESYKNKFVFNQKGGTLEIVSTDSRELLKLTHYSGSFKEFNNQSTVEFAANNNQSLILGDNFNTIRGTNNQYIDNDSETIIRGDHYRKVGNFNTEAFKEWEKEVEVMAGIKQQFETKRATFKPNDIIQKTSPADKRAVGTFAPCPLCTAETRPSFWNINNKGPLAKIPTFTFIFPVSFLPLYNLATSALFKYGAVPANSGNFLGSGPCPVCDGTGVSPSSYLGTFKSNDKDKSIKAKLRTMISDLALIEKKLGTGGSEIINITKHKVETVGLRFNKFPSIRVDDIGKINHNEVKIFREGVTTSFATSPLIEYTHVDDMPGGTYSLNVCNRYNVQVGAGGISLKSYGPVDISGSITNIAGEQINIASENEVNIIAGKRIDIAAEILTLRQTSGKQVLVDSNLGVSQNVIIGGGLHVEGELSVHHITAPLEQQETDTNTAFGELIGGMKIGIAVGTGNLGAPVISDVYALPMPQTVRVYEHQHTFSNIPLTLTNNSDSVRVAAQSLEEPIKASPQPANPVRLPGFMNVGDMI